jgi:hypothetical protein
MKKELPKMLCLLAELLNFYLGFVLFFAVIFFSGLEKSAAPHFVNVHCQPPELLGS